MELFRCCPHCKQELAKECFPHPNSFRGRYQSRCFMCYYTTGRIVKARKHSKKRTKLLPDSVVAARIAAGTQITISDIPKPLIDAKRQLILLKRELRKHKK